MSFPSDPGSGTLHYVGVDATDPVDTLGWGVAWRLALNKGSERPWQNVLRAALSPKAGAKVAKGQISRLDKGKALAMELTSDPMYARRFRDAGVLPLGPAPLLEPGWHLTESDVADGCEFAKRFILCPSADANGLNAVGKGAVADVLLISGHSGGESIYGKDRNKNYRHIFDVPEAALGGRKFVGPRWLILSSCWACQASSEQWWYSLMTGGSSLRGIIGFQLRFPDAYESVPPLEAFSKELAQGRTFLSAWPRSHPSSFWANYWVVLCHDEAAEDKISDLHQGRLQDPIGFNVLRFDNQNKGTPMRRLHNVFTAHWFKKERITWEGRTESKNLLREGDAVEVGIFPFPKARTFQSGARLEITLVCRRIDYPQRIDIRKMFELKDAVGVPLKDIKTVKRNTAERRPAWPSGEAAKDMGHDTWVMTIKADEVERVRLFLWCKRSTKGHPDDGLGGLKDPSVILWLRVAWTSPGSSLPTVNDFERDGAILAMK
jgi:hypothetical protein